MKEIANSFNKFFSSVLLIVIRSVKTISAMIQKHTGTTENSLFLKPQFQMTL